MFKTFIVGTVAVVVLAVSAPGSPRAEAATNASPAGTALAQAYDGYGGPRYCGYYHYVCRGWWKACRWEGPYFLSVPYWGMRYLCL
jgi:hypothetical protein